MSFAVLILIVIVALLVALAASRGHGRGLLMAAGVFVVLFLLLIGARASYHSERVQAVVEREQAVQMRLAEMQAHGQPIPGTNLIEYTNEPAPVAAPRATVLVVLALLIGLPLLILAVVRRRSPTSTGRPIAAIFAGVLGVFVLGAFILVPIRVLRQEHVATPSVAWQERVDIAPQAIMVAGQQPRHADNVPHDDLWEEFTRPRIQLSSTSTAAKNGEASAAHADESEHGHDHAAEAPPVPVDAAPNAGHDHLAESDAESHSASSTPASPVASVAPAVQAEAAPRPKPEWVLNPLKFIDDGMTRLVVQAGPYSTARECYDSLRTEMREAVRQRIEQLVRESTGNSYVDVPELEEMRLGDSYIDRELLADRYVQTDDGSFGLTQSAWGLLKFTRAQDEHLVDKWKSYARLGGIKAAMALSATVLTILGSIFALLKFDTWTRGYYTKRLFLGVPAAIIGVLLLFLAASKT